MYRLPHLLFSYLRLQTPAYPVKGAELSNQLAIGGAIACNDLFESLNDVLNAGGNLDFPRETLVASRQSCGPTRGFPQLEVFVPSLSFNVGHLARGRRS